MLTEEQAASAYELATGGCRHSLVVTRDNARHEQQFIDADQDIQDAEDREARRESQNARMR